MIPSGAFIMIPVVLILVMIYLVIGLLQKTKMKPSTIGVKGKPIFMED
jgi:cell division septal protein FtsQ